MTTKKPVAPTKSEPKHEEPKPTAPERGWVSATAHKIADKLAHHDEPKKHGWKCDVCGTSDISTPRCPVDGSAR